MRVGSVSVWREFMFLDLCMHVCMHSPPLEGPGMRRHCDQVVTGTNGQARALRAWKESVNMCEIISF